MTVLYTTWNREARPFRISLSPEWQMTRESQLTGLTDTITAPELVAVTIRRLARSFNEPTKTVARRLAAGWIYNTGGHIYRRVSR